MRINQDELNRRLKSANNLADLIKHTNESSDLSPPSLFNPLNPMTSATAQVTHETIDHAHRKDRPNIPEPVREVMGCLGELNAYNKVARAFEVSIPAVQQAVSGRVGGRPANRERAEKVAERRLTIEDIALGKLMKSLDLIDEERMEECSARDLSMVSTNLARVSQLMRDSNTTIGQQTNIVVYSPERKAEDKYKIVDV